MLYMYGGDLSLMTERCTKLNVIVQAYTKLKCLCCFT